MLVFILWALSFTILVHGAVESNCTGFAINDIANSTFQYYRLYDFRNVGSSPTTAMSPQKSKTVTDGSWTNDWYIRDYPRKSAGPPVIPITFTPKRVNIAKSTDKSPDYATYLTMSTARLSDEVQEGGEMTFQEFNVSYASIRVLGRIRGTTGACAGIFTYLNDTEETDIEILTRDPTNIVHYSNQPTSSGNPDWIPIPGASVNVSMADGKHWTDWHIHRLDWTPGRSTFFVDGIQANTTTLNVPTPEPPSPIYIDMWGANSSWVGEMPIGGEAWFDIQWVELLFNTSTESSPSPANANLCAPTVGPKVATTSWGERLTNTDSRILTLWSLLVALIIVPY